MYPKLEVKVNQIIENIDKMKQVCEAHHIQLTLVTKVLAGNASLVSRIATNHVAIIGDSRIQNLSKFQDIPVEKWLIRAPSLSEISEVIHYADVSLNSEITTIKALNEEALRQNRQHKIILMYELGDLREGCNREELKSLVKECLSLKGISLYGIGANLSCYGEILPSTENMADLLSVVKEIEEKMHIKLPIISGGNSSSYGMLQNDTLPHEINNLRLGESVFLGRIPCQEEEIRTLNHDNFVLKAQIIEVKEKPSVPWGKTGKCNSFGEHTSFVDKGIRKRALIALGKQDISPTAITPFDDKIELLAGSSDHIILDVTDSDTQYQVGDVIPFHLNYSGVLQAMSSPYIEKEIE